MEIQQLHLAISPDEALLLRKIGARINGAFGGLTKSRNRAAASRRNLKKARRARKLAIAA